MAIDKKKTSGCFRSDDPAHALAHKFWRFGPAFERWTMSKVNEFLPSKRITPPKVRLMSILMDRGPCIMSALKDELGVTATSITSLVDALEAEGLVSRRAHPSDRRATIIELTGKALDEMQVNRDELEERICSLFRALTPEERAFLLAVMDKLEKHLEQANTA